jgi:hypothetical protein
MIKAEQIPEEVAKELQREFDERGVFLSLGSAAAIVAGTLAAWPGAEVDGDDDPFDPSGAWEQKHIILPLQEKTNEG